MLCLCLWQLLETLTDAAAVCVCVWVWVWVGGGVCVWRERERERERERKWLKVSVCVCVCVCVKRIWIWRQREEWEKYEWVSEWVSVCERERVRTNLQERMKKTVHNGRPHMPHPPYVCVCVCVCVCMCVYVWGGLVCTETQEVNRKGFYDDVYLGVQAAPGLPTLVRRWSPRAHTTAEMASLIR